MLKSPFFFYITTLNLNEERISEAKKETQTRLKKAEASGASTAELEKQLNDWKLKEKELLDKEKKEPLNVDTIGTEAWR